MFLPFTGEANINVDSPVFALPQTMAHEMAHSLVIGRENEADFSGFLACVNSTDTLTQYSGYAMALLSCTNDLYAADPELYYDVREQIDPGVLQDFAEYSKHVNKYKGIVNNVSASINDLSIKIRGDELGIQAYSKVVDLLVGWVAQQQPQ